MSPIMASVWDTLNVRTDEHVGISPLTKKQVMPNSSVADHLLFCNHSASYDDFTILTGEKKVFTRIQREAVNNER